MGVYPSQRALINLTLAGLGLAMIASPAVAWSMIAASLSGLFFLLVVWCAILIGIGSMMRLFRRRALTPNIPPTDLPIYSILVPLYQEAALLPQIARALNAVDWPPDRRDIQLLIEADDTDTLSAAQATPLPTGTRITTVPPGGPRTKPNALNYGLARARGRYITVYDAEDLPHRDQLKTAFETFLSASERTICLQAPLVADNADQNWLTAQWALDYRVQFGVMLPALSWLRLPVLLGGTSNHFRTDALIALGGWDAWNVTEDADLGIRIARAGLQCGHIPVQTDEDAPRQLRIWIAQRSRWIKGFMQTWLVLMRSPGRALRELGWVRFVAAHLSLIAAILAPLAFAPCLLLVGAILILEPFEIGPVGLTLIAASLGVSLLGDLTAPGPWSVRRCLAMLTRLIYWPLHTLAAIRAVWELAKNPFFWAKTPHRPRTTDPCKDISHSCSIGSSASPSLPD